MVGTQRDTVVFSRQSTAVDSEGNPSGTTAYATSSTERGTWGSPSGRDSTRAAQRNTDLDAVVVVRPRADVRPGDEATVRGTTYEVIAVVPTRLSQRVLLRTLA